MAADPTGEYHLGDHSDPDNDDAYRIEFDTASRAVVTGTPPTFGRADAIDQAATIEAVRTAAATGTTVTLPPPPRLRAYRCAGPALSRSPVGGDAASLP